MATTAATRASPVTPPNPGDGRSPTAGLPGTGAAHRVRAGSLCLSPATPNRPAAVGRLSATPALSTAAAAVAAGFVPAGAAPGERPTKTKRRSRPRPRASADSHKWNTGKWSKDEDAALREGVAVVGARQWKRISVEFLHNQRSDVQCLHRWQKVLRPGLVKGSWEKEEDETIVRCIQQGIVKWSEIAAHIPGRLGKQCRERWFNHLDPSIKKGGWTAEEDSVLEQAQATLGNRWCKIAELLPGRTENAVKNRWHSAKRRQAHAARMASRAAAADAARKNGTPLPPSPKIQLPTPTRRKTKSHVPTPEAAMEAARRCGLDVTGDMPLPLMRGATGAQCGSGVFVPTTLPRTPASAAAAAAMLRGIRPSSSPTRSAPSRRPFITPPPRTRTVGGEVVAPAGADPRSPDYGLLQLIIAIDTKFPADREEWDGGAAGASAPCANVASPRPRASSNGLPSPRVASDDGVPRHRRRWARPSPLCHEEHMEEPAVHAPLSPMSDESYAVEALQAMHCAAVGRFTPSPPMPMHLAVGKRVTTQDQPMSYTLLPQAARTAGETGVTKFIVHVAPRPTVVDSKGYAVNSAKRERPIEADLPEADDGGLAAPMPVRASKRARATA